MVLCLFFLLIINGLARRRREKKGEFCQFFDNIWQVILVVKPFEILPVKNFLLTTLTGYFLFFSNLATVHLLTKGPAECFGTTKITNEPGLPHQIMYACNSGL